MYCRKCGAENPDNGVFCAKCGERIAGGNTAVPNTGAAVGNQKLPKKKSKGKVIVLGIVAAVVAFICFLAVLGRSGSSTPDTKEPEQVKVLFDVKGLIDPDTRVFLTREQIEEKYDAVRPKEGYGSPDSSDSESLDIAFIFKTETNEFHHLAGLLDNDSDDYPCKKEDIPAAFGLHVEQCEITEETDGSASFLPSRDEPYRNNIISITYNCLNFGADVPVSIQIAYDTAREVICRYNIYNPDLL